ncbi:MAG: hypothetical protein JO281_05020 [Pseudonocardiales bacterium]|nr:hypothetical protein [Pseudonocardiales bacterium]
MTGEDNPTSDQRRLVIHATCALHRGPAGFTNVVVSKRTRPSNSIRTL